ncbi:MAG: hypothetical protein Q8M98_01650 [Candidatus Cloacimonadaceae bacterium]|nr:hypothetical protein [Candidatus Cloacimonadaceae bacterium]
MTDLLPNTNYYARSFATNIAGTSYGTDESFRTLSEVVISVSDIMLPGFGEVLIGSVSGTASFEVSASGLVDSLLISAPNGFELTLGNRLGSRNFSQIIILISDNGNVSETSILIRFAPNRGGNLSNYVTFSSAGAQNQQMMVYGIGITTPTVSTSAITDITHNSAVAGGNILSDGWSSITACGVCWDTNPTPDIFDAHTSNITPLGEFSDDITGLQSNTTYFVRAYATNAAGTTYGEQITYMTALGTVGTPQNVQISFQNGNIVLTWNAVTNAQSYHIFRSADPYAEDWGLPYATTSLLTYTDTGIGGSNRFFYKITADTAE